VGEVEGCVDQVVVPGGSKVDGWLLFEALFMYCLVSVCSSMFICFARISFEQDV
jgi:hypothetical protein